MCDVYSPGALSAAAVAAAPEVVINALSDLSAGPGPANARIREEGGPIVAHAARQARARRLVVASIAFATSPASARAVEALERGAFESGLDAVVLRFGRFWGPGTWSETAAEPPAVHVDEAGRRAAALLTAPPGTYVIVTTG